MDGYEAPQTHWCVRGTSFELYERLQSSPVGAPFPYAKLGRSDVGVGKSSTACGGSSHIQPKTSSRILIWLSFTGKPGSIALLLVGGMANTMTDKNESVTASGALSSFTLAPETPARRSCRRDKSDYVLRPPPDPESR